MANADQILALLKSHIEGDDNRFLSIAMQVAANEAKSGHAKLAKEIRALIDQKKATQETAKEGSPFKAIPISSPKGELSNLLFVSYPKLKRSDMVLSEQVGGRITRLIKEQRHIAEIKSYGLSPRKKLLLIGQPGTGKSMTASVLAGELGLPLFVVRLDNLMTKFMGETATKLRLIFDSISKYRGVYFFDEFDAIGSSRGLSNDIGEIRRILNSFLQLIEEDQSNSLILAATNHQEILDPALFRRFDDIVKYELPPKELIIKAVKAKLTTFKKDKICWTKIANEADGLSYADLTNVCEDAIKDAIINKRDSISTNDLVNSILDRKSFHS